MSSDLQCELCSTVGPDVDYGYVRVVRQTVYPGTVQSKWLSLRCDCCGRCVRKAQQIKERRFLVVGGMLAWLFLAPCLLSPLGLFLGEKGSARNIAILGGGLALVVGGFLAGPVYLRAYNRRATTRLLGPEADHTLRTLAGIKSWGLLSEVLIVRDLPEGEPEEPLRPGGRRV